MYARLTLNSQRSSFPLPPELLGLKAGMHLPVVVVLRVCASVCMSAYLSICLSVHSFSDPLKTKLRVLGGATRALNH